MSVLGGLKPKALIADGESQSAFFLTTYIDAVAPWPTSTTATSSTADGGAGRRCRGLSPSGVHEPFRTDLGVPVLAFETETDLNEGYAGDRQPDNRWFRDWEVAGTSHADDYTIIGINDNGRSNVAGAIVTEDTPSPSSAVRRPQLGAPALGARRRHLRFQPVGQDRDPPPHAPGSS
jgi:hypothetical protein